MLLVVVVEAAVAATARLIGSSVGFRTHAVPGMPSFDRPMVAPIPELAVKAVVPIQVLKASKYAYLSCVAVRVQSMSHSLCS